MPLRMIDVAGISYAYVILLGEEACTAMVYSGSITHLELARLVMHHAQNVMTTLDCNDGVFWAWTGPIHKLSLVMGSPLWSSCACCFKRAALSDSSKCCRCHYFRYCSSECMKNTGGFATSAFVRLCRGHMITSSAAILDTAKWRMAS